MQWYMFGGTVWLGAPRLRCTNGHIRVDLFYAKLNDRQRTWLDLAGQSLDLTRKEALVLETRLRAQGRSCTKGLLLDASSDGRREVGEDTIKAHVRNLRSKLMAAGATPDLIETVYGLGYRLNPSALS